MINEDGMTKTSRGFGYLEFRDRYDYFCTFQQSSLALEECVWLGVHESRMHLTREMAGDIGRLLLRFESEGEDMFL